MKGIKDIGLPIGQVTRLPWTGSGIVTTTTSASEFPLGVFLSQDERRELVRRVWDAALDCCEFDTFSGPRATKSPDDWIKENDL